MERNPINLIICQQAIELLLYNEQTPLSQVEIIEGLSNYGCKIAESTLTNIKKFNPALKKGKTVSPKTLSKAAASFKKLVQVTLSKIFNERQLTFEYMKGAGEIIAAPIINTPDGGEKIIYHSGGRKTMEYKISFMEQAPTNTTIIELGVRLHSFSTYFDNASDEIYKNRVRKILAKGINLHCLMMDFRHELTKTYFQLRTAARPAEKGKFEEMKEVSERLRALQFELNNEGYSGKVGLFNYVQFPEYHALVVKDKMLISPYILGEKRGNCPVIEIHKNKAPNLFRRYLQSIHFIKKQAKQIK